MHREGAVMVAAHPCAQAAALAERRASKRMSVMPGNSRRGSGAQRDLTGGTRFRVCHADSGPRRTCGAGQELYYSVFPSETANRCPEGAASLASPWHPASPEWVPFLAILVQL